MAAGGVEHGVPVGVGDIVALELAQDFRREDKQQNDDLQGVGQINVQPPLQQGGQHKEHQGQSAGEGAFVVAPEDMVDQQTAHNQTQSKV